MTESLITKVLICDDEEIALDNLSYLLKKMGMEVFTAFNGKEALDVLGREKIEILLTDLRMPEMDGMELLKHTRIYYPETEVIIITAYASPDATIEAIDSGAYISIAKPFQIEEIRKVVSEAEQKIKLKKENILLKNQIESLKDNCTLITKNSQMIRLIRLSKQVALSEGNVIITGESGTGKEIFARLIHAGSLRSEGPFFAINCGAFPPELLASELFGFEKGSFTGAHQKKKGLIEMADGGTLFLDELTEMPLSMQVNLLRVIQEKEILPVGGTKSIKVDTRFIAATNRSIKAAIEKQFLRRDLYYRLNTFVINLPPLSERQEDIPLLINGFIKKFSEKMKKNIKSVSEPVMEILSGYSYPGNVRELENIIERAVAVSETDEIRPEDLPEDLTLFTTSIIHQKEFKEITTLAENEKQYISWVLNNMNGNKTASATALGIDRSTLWRKLKEYGLE
jgi:DNA-binding NtrC family response regulator